MQETITQAIRPYLAHLRNAHLAAECAHAAQAGTDDVDERRAFLREEWAAGDAAQCARAHAQLAAKRARDALAAPAVQPLHSPAWVGTVNIDAGFDPARRRSVTTQMVAILARHSQRVHDAIERSQRFTDENDATRDACDAAAVHVGLASMQATTTALVSVLR